MTDGQSQTDVLLRVGNLEGGFEGLRNEIGNVKQQVSGVRDDVGQVRVMLSAMADKMGTSRQTNWSVVIGAGGLCVAVITAIGSGFIMPLRVTDAHIEVKLESIESILRADHDRITRLEEREKLYRETGMIGVQRGN